MFLVLLNLATELLVSLPVFVRDDDDVCFCMFISTVGGGILGQIRNVFECRRWVSSHSNFRENPDVTLYFVS
jgi:hypothetical protein